MVALVLIYVISVEYIICFHKREESFKISQIGDILNLINKFLVRVHAVIVALCSHKCNVIFKKLKNFIYLFILCHYEDLKHIYQ